MGRDTLNDDKDAWDILDKNFYDYRGIIIKEDPNHPTSPQEWEAINYLLAEWDYEYYGDKPNADG